MKKTILLSALVIALTVTYAQGPGNGGGFPWDTTGWGNGSSGGGNGSCGGSGFPWDTTGWGSGSGWDTTGWGSGNGFPWDTTGWGSGNGFPWDTTGWGTGNGFPWDTTGWGSGNGFPWDTTGWGTGNGFPWDTTGWGTGNGCPWDSTGCPWDTTGTGTSTGGGSSIVSPLNIASEGFIIEEISLYPNPVADMANVAFRSTESGMIAVEIYSMEGRLIRSISENVTVGSNVISINVSELPKGNYIVRTDKDSKGLRFIK